jgi:hypothetical protein
LLRQIGIFDDDHDHGQHKYHQYNGHNIGETGPHGRFGATASDILSQVYVILKFVHGTNYLVVDKALRYRRIGDKIFYLFGDDAGCWFLDARYLKVSVFF